jgi:biopolymer transport protein ExbD
MVMNKRRIRLSADPNLTPILDMVFQLITFFMLVVSFKTAAMDPGIRLPVLGSARPSQQEAERTFVVLNIDAAGSLRVFGQVCDLEQYLVREADSIRRASSNNGGDASTNGLHAAAVVRADRSTPFNKLNRVLAVCKKHGFQNVTLKVLGAESGAALNDIPL